MPIVFATYILTSYFSNFETLLITTLTKILSFLLPPTIGIMYLWASMDLIHILIDMVCTLLLLYM
jgi:hypothetical protein